LLEGKFAQAGRDNHQQEHQRQHNPAAGDQSAQVGQVVGSVGSTGDERHGANYA